MVQVALGPESEVRETRFFVQGRPIIKGSIGQHYDDADGDVTTPITLDLVVDGGEITAPPNFDFDNPDFFGSIYV